MECLTVSPISLIGDREECHPVKGVLHHARQVQCLGGQLGTTSSILAVRLRQDRGLVVEIKSIVNFLLNNNSWFETSQRYSYIISCSIDCTIGVWQARDKVTVKWVLDSRAYYANDRPVQNNIVSYGVRLALPFLSFLWEKKPWPFCKIEISCPLRTFYIKKIHADKYPRLKQLSVVHRSNIIHDNR